MVNEWKQIAYKKLDADADTITLGETTAKTTDFSDDFAVNNWTNIEGTNVVVTGGVLTYDANAGEVASEYRDYGSVLPDQFVTRFKWNIDTTSNGASGSDNDVMITISSNTSGMATVQDAVGFGLRTDSVQTALRTHIWDNQALTDNGGQTTQLVDPVTQNVLYCEIIRHSNRIFRFNVFSDSNFSDLLWTDRLVNSADLLDLRYLKVGANDEAGDSSNDGSVDNWEFWENTNTVVEGGFEPHDMMKLVVYAEPSGGTLGLRGYVNEDLGGSKSSRYSQNGASDVTTGTEQSTFDWIPSVAENNRFLESIILDFPNQEKLFINHSLRDGGLGSGVAPTRLESVVKYENQVDRLISITIINSAGAGDMKKGSYAILYGAQRPTITHANGNTLVEVQGDTI